MFDNPILGSIFSGYLFCVDTLPKEKEQKLSAYNYGDGKRYQLWYFSENEVTT